MIEVVVVMLKEQPQRSEKKHMMFDLDDYYYPQK